MMRKMGQYMLCKLRDDIPCLTTPILQIQHDVIDADRLMHLQKIDQRVPAQPKAQMYRLGNCHRVIQQIDEQ